MNRTALALTLALAAAALAAGCTTSKECSLPTIKCGDRCLDPRSDAQNCGACGVACAAGQVCCGSCMDPEALQTDTANCGACGHHCQPNATCTAGTCACTGGFPDDCGGACVNLQTGAGGYCGVCGRVCQGTDVAGTDATCTAGACVCSGAATDCSATSPMLVCANTSKDEANCGGCGTRCKPHAVCTGGACGCTDPAFPDSCPGACVNFQSDAANCGSCGHACTGATPTCSAGLCCPTGWTACSGACVDTRTSTANCGSCGNACPGQQICGGGACDCATASPKECGSLCCAGTACCAGGTACQTAHSNGLGGTFYDCTAAYTTSSLTRDVAVAAASTWQPAMAYQDSDLFCAGSCLARQTSTACAMWCYGGTYAGRATSGGIVCGALCNNLIGGGGSTWP